MIALLLWACTGGGAGTDAAAALPVDPGLAECAVCGMVVREQPAPRGQVVRHDGTREHACSLGDLRALLAVPSPHGRVEATWVEVVPADLTPEQVGTDPRTWVPADDAWYVAGIERQHVMGVPLLSYATAQEAQTAAARLGGYTSSWAQLVDTPFDRAPAP